MAIAFDAPCTTRRISSSGSGSGWCTSDRWAAGEGAPDGGACGGGEACACDLRIARAYPARHLAPRQRSWLTRGASPREKRCVQAYCSLVPSALGALAAAAGGCAALPHLAFACAGAGPDHAGGGDAYGPAGRARLSWGWADGAYGLSAVMRPLAPETLRETRRGWRKPVPVSHCSYSAAVWLCPSSSTRMVRLAGGLCEAAPRPGPLRRGRLEVLPRGRRPV